MQVNTDIGADGRGMFYYPARDGRAAEMEVAVAGSTLTVYHTEVRKEFENQGMAKGLLAQMVAYAREHSLKVNPLCPFVSAQFRRHPLEYADLWKAATA